METKEQEKEKEKEGHKERPTPLCTPILSSPNPSPFAISLFLRTAFIGKKAGKIQIRMEITITLHHHLTPPSYPLPSPFNPYLDPPKFSMF
jgi:hypothetical protein